MKAKQYTRTSANLLIFSLHISKMAFQYKHVLIIGATSGIGKGMADHFIAQGIKVTAVGRRQDRLDEFVAQHGSDKASAIAFDIAKLDEIPAFIKA